MKKRAFTLAEVLITLAIIGIVAAIALPALTSSYKYKQLGTRCAKFHSAFQNAAMSAVAGNTELRGGAVGEDGSYSNASLTNLAEATFVTKDGTAWNGAASVLQDGTSVEIVNVPNTFTTALADNVGNVIGAVTLHTNIRGLKANAQSDYTFVVTSAGFLFPADDCTGAVVDADYVTNESNGTYDNSGACINTPQNS